ncbi:MAG: hypothetical protein K6A30_08840 [Lachnospiraceae bacterium]|nr:hypothetical protein [Lachnospiraceae bacterium]
MEKLQNLRIIGEEGPLALLTKSQIFEDFEVNEALLVREEGCYMHDYIIDGSGRIVRTDIQHVIDYTLKKRKK